MSHEEDLRADSAALDKKIRMVEAEIAEQKELIQASAMGSELKVRDLIMGLKEAEEALCERTTVISSFQLTQ